MEPKSTVENSLTWRLWHSLNFLFGGVAFFFGSAILFPHVNRIIPASAISGWCYTLGSFTFLMADITECLHFVHSDCRFIWYAINFFLSVTGSAIYLIGSICFLPQVNRNDLGLDYFIVGSIVIMISQVWKLCRTFCQPKKSCKQAFHEDPSGVFIDFFAGVGGFCYWFSPTFFYEKISTNRKLAYPGATVYTIGGACFLITAIFILKRYFCQQKQVQNSLMPQEK